MNATDPETAARIQAMLASTTLAVGRTPVADDVRDNLRRELQQVCQKIAIGVVEAEDADGFEDTNPTERSITTMIAVAEAMASEMLRLQRWLWDEAARRGVSDTAVARARGVTQQAVSKRAAKAQRK